jgi:hypothetical protein
MRMLMNQLIIILENFRADSNTRLYVQAVLSTDIYLMNYFLLTVGD